MPTFVKDVPNVPAHSSAWWESDGPFGPEYAWSFLIDLRVLRHGMTIEEAERILGKADRRPDPPDRVHYLRWYLAPPAT